MAERKVGMTDAPPAPVASSGDASSTAPILPPEIQPVYVPVGRKVARDAKIVYRPAILGKAKLHYVDSKAAVDSGRR